MSRITKINLKGVEYDVGMEITVDSALSSSSTNPVQNKIVKAALDGKQETVVGGTGLAVANDGKTINHSNSVRSSLPGATTKSSIRSQRVWPSGQKSL